MYDHIRQFQEMFENFNMIEKLQGSVAKSNEILYSKNFNQTFWKNLVIKYYQNTFDIQINKNFHFATCNKLYIKFYKEIKILQEKPINCTISFNDNEDIIYITNVKYRDINVFFNIISKCI